MFFGRIINVIVPVIDNGNDNILAKHLQAVKGLEQKMTKVVTNAVSSHVIRLKFRIDELKTTRLSPGQSLLTPQSPVIFATGFPLLSQTELFNYRMSRLLVLGSLHMPVQMP